MCVLNWNESFDGRETRSGDAIRGGRKGLKNICGRRTESLPPQDADASSPLFYPPINHTRPRAVCLQSYNRGLLPRTAATRHMSGMNGSDAWHFSYKKKGNGEHQHHYSTCISTGNNSSCSSSRFESLALLDYTLFYISMGQHGSCIQGQPDWSGAYKKASIKAQEAEIYGQLRKLATLTPNTKDLQEFENFLKNKINPTCPQHGSKAFLQSNTKSNLTLPTPSNYEDLFRKESICKDINFNGSQTDSKPPSIKEVIVTKTPCKVHGHAKTEEAPKPAPCRVHGHQRPQSTDSESKSESHRSPPTYKHPPTQRAPTPHRIAFEYEDFSDDDSSASTFSCPEFLTSLILPSDEIETLDILASVGVQSAKEIIQRLEDRGESIVETFGVVLKHLEHGDWSTFCISTSRLCDDIKNVMRDYHLSTEVKDTAALKIRNQVTDALNQLTTKILSLNQTTSAEINHNVLLPSFKVLGEALHEMMEFLISKELKVLIDCLNPDTKTSSIRMAACALAEMSLSGGLMSKLIVQAGAVTPLLNICNTRKCKYLRPLALRILTVICSTPKAVEEFENVSGFRTILTLLSQESEEKVLCETVGLLAQVLKQWSEKKSSFEDKIGQDMERLVQHLSEAAKKSLSPEMFLLSAACLATLSSCNAQATSWLKVHAQEMRLLACSSNKQESYV
ncbi:hypothetical protein JTE90_026273 [Oedothorax gibbosus]|uniref:Protein inscuteable homologue C-terminal domain-containing protein n=1 Tax=Oedothorax gibbosus TaxID=931172 RepID=A0AAV6U1G4_9ARAC|nr:hypothetical protein JTE90_026273 [Oedothorax gibbosus]